MAPQTPDDNRGNVYPDRSSNFSTDRLAVANVADGGDARSSATGLQAASAPLGEARRHPYRNPGTGPRQRGAAHAAPGRPAGPALAARPPAIRPGCLLPSLRATRPASRAAASSRPGRHKGCRAAVGHVAGRHRAGFRERLSREAPATWSRPPFAPPAWRTAAGRATENDPYSEGTAAKSMACMCV